MVYCTGHLALHMFRAPVFRRAQEGLLRNVYPPHRDHRTHRYAEYYLDYCTRLCVVDIQARNEGLVLAR